MKRTYAKRLAATIVASSLLLTSCSQDDSANQDTATSQDSSTASAESTQAESASSDETITVENCGDTIELEGVPERVTILHVPNVPTLDALGVFDAVTAKGGVFLDEYFSDELNAKLDQVESLSEELAPNGHIEISREEVVASNPDIVIGETTNVTPDTLAPNGIPVILEEGACGGLEGDAKWEDVNTHIDLYATIFDREEEGEKLKEETQQQIDDALASVDETEQLSAAVLYPTIGGGVTYAYGRGSMSHPILETAGFENVFADESDRVFEVNAEQIVDRSPEVIVALYSEGDPEEVVQAVRELQGAETMPAVQEDRIIALPIFFLEYASLLNLEGLERLLDEAQAF
ncbi:ABC transporter substrate-binding protein [Corynebacterium pilosum]|uniref:Zinc ABC transport system substrate-binding protein n=1 Tax=Corynebacterium pilosum TaxID=35756 RepID=A0A376CML8_9CORY|nr:ABC transporter substrate-binding protein [Corynebacterium pilosum]STC69457.1 zinc ABC transport system substrate-binding protein [Corynebacterium pilosum]